MKYALKLDEDYRILYASVVLPNGNYENMSLVDCFPEGDLHQYLYIDGEYIYDPLPEPEQPEPEPTPESRITALEQTLDALIGGIMDAV